MNWISVKDRLPKKVQSALVYAPDSYGDNVLAVCFTTNPKENYHWLTSQGKYIPDVTHWMPLPEPPKELCGEKWLNGEYDKKS